MSESLVRLDTALADRCRIERELGAGGMATVYLAEDLKHERQVALKVLQPELAAAIGTERFLREIKITAKLHRPHTGPLVATGVIRDCWSGSTIPRAGGCETSSRPTDGGSSSSCRHTKAMCGCWSCSRKGVRPS